MNDDTPSWFKEPEPYKRPSVLSNPQFRKHFTQITHGALGVAAAGVMVLGARTHAPQDMVMDPPAPTQTISTVHTGGDQINNAL